jgi:hypothetical protein
MLDTVAVRIPVQLSPKQKFMWGNNRNYPPNNANGETEYFYQTITSESGAVIVLKWYPANLKFPESAMIIHVSLPKILFGENISMIRSKAQVEEAVRAVNHAFRTKEWMPNLDLGKGFLVRVDIPYNHHVGSLLHEYLEVMFRLQYSQRETKPYYPGYGVVYHSKIARTTFYDKKKESMSISADGILRQETSIRKGFNIERRMGIPWPKLYDVSKAWTIAMLRKDLSQLGLCNLTISNREFALDVLVEEYGFVEGIKLYGYMNANKYISREEALSLGVSRNTLLNWNNKIDAAGISPNFSERKELPGLEINL